MSINADAADFTKAKKVFVPPSKIPRRMDSESVKESDTSGYDSSYNPAFGMPGVDTLPPVTTKSAPNKYGLIPPPPPITPSLLPASLLHAQVPPPPGVGLSAGSPAEGRWSTTVANTLSRASKSTQVKSIVDQAQDRATKLAQEGKFTEAQQMLLRQLKAYPKDKAVQAQLAQVTVSKAKQLLSSGSLETAAVAARNALTLQPTNASASSVLAEVLNKQGIKSDNPAERIKLAQKFAAEGQTNDAAVEYRQALALKPSAEAHIGLGDLALKSGARDKAKAEYQKALETQPDSAPALRQMGMLQLAQNDVVGANSNLSRALVINPNDKLASTSLINLWQSQVNHNPSNVNGHLGLARAYQISGNLQSAQGEYRQVVHLDPNNANLPAARHSFKLALARQQAQRSVEAAQTLEAQGALQPAYQKVSDAANLCPGDTKIKLYQAQLAQKLGMTGAARFNYMSVLGSDPTNVAAAQQLSKLPAGQPEAPMLLQGNGLAPATASSGLIGAAAAGSAALASLVQPVAELPPVPVLPGSSMVSAAAAAAAGGAAQAAAPAATQAGVPDSPANLGSFLNSMRNTAVKNQLAMQEWESQVHKNLTGRSSYYEANGQLGDVPVTPEAIIGANTGANAAAPSSDRFVSRALADLGFGQTVPAANTGSIAAAGVQSSSPAGAGVSGAPSGLPGSTSSASSAASPATQSKIQAYLQSIGYGIPASANAGATQGVSPAPSLQGSATAGALAAAPVGAASISPNTSALQQQNAQLQSQLLQAQQQLSAMHNGGTGAINAYGAAPSGLPSSMNSFASGIPATNGALAAAIPTAPPIAQSAAAFGSSASANALMSSLPPSMAGVLHSPAANGTLAALRPSIQPGAAVKLELEGVKPSPTAINLRVVLRNDQGVPLQLPAHTRAVIRMNGVADRQVSASFPAKSVPPGGVLHGTIHIPGHNLSPAADLYLPNFLPSTVSGVRDVHLTVPISSL